MNARAVSEACSVKGRFQAAAIPCDEMGAAVGVVNYVNVFGPGPIELSAPIEQAAMEAQFDSLDPGGLWASWWQRAAGESTRFGLVAEADSPPSFLCSRPPAEGRLLGVNVGGRYLDAVLAVNGDIIELPGEKVGNGVDSSLAGATIEQFADRLRALSPGRAYLDGVGLSWSAPRTRLGLRAMSIATAGGGALFEALDNGQLEQVLSSMLGCPVRCWNDGEAVAASEFVASPGNAGSTRLALKLGTSFAAGLATEDSVSGLPIQLSKCLMPTLPLVMYPHPVTHMRGTCRDAIGAHGMERAFQFKTGNSHASYVELIKAWLADSSTACDIVDNMIAVLAEVIEYATRLWGDSLRVTLTGKNLAEPLLRNYVLDKLNSRGQPSQVGLASQVDGGIGAAYGAIVLTSSNMEDRN